MNLEEKLELKLESLINNPQFVCREKKKKTRTWRKKKLELEEKKLERIVAAQGLENYVMRLPQGWYL